ncbi:MAG: type VI secretion protein IcmF/TssM N-terminal domain-containing protein [Pseudomonadota bacterium]
MIRFLFTALKIFLLLALAVAVGFGALLLADHEGWPRWIVAVAVAGVFSVLVLVLFIRRYYYRRREEKFVRRVMDQDQQAIEAAPAHERRRLMELQARWTQAVATLRASRLRHRGDPLYTLPWFMIFGETSSGKSTAVSHARLTSILSDVGPTKGIASTRNCDWWFFERAVILDTAGRYAVPLEAGDGDEWERFLVLLAKYRRKEPLNGLIVTLPCDRLLADSQDALVEYGRSIRLRVDQLMRVLGAKFPVYVLVTKLDLVMGMTAMAELLPEEQRGQAMGLLNDTEQRAPEEFLDEAIGHVSRRLKNLRLLLASRVGASGGRAALFPDEFECLAPRIRAFVDGAFRENPYQETPFLRGFFISSGRQSGLTRSGVLGSLESFKDRQWRLPDTGLGLFLHDFFAAILPKDRAGFRPLGEYLSWRTATMNLALGAWLLLLLTGIGLSSLSYVQIREAMQPVHASFAKAPVLGENLAQDLVTLGLMRDKIAEMQRRLHGGIWPRMGFFQGHEVLAGLQRKYNQWFRAAVLTPTDEIMGKHFASLDTEIREEALAPYLEYLLWRIDTLKAREAGHPRSDAPGHQDSPLQALALAFGGRLPYVAAFFPDMYRSYARWEEDTGIISRERREMEVWANRIIDLEGRDLHWLVDWADSRADLPDVILGDFWAGLGQESIPVGISGAFTKQGKDKIEKLLAQTSQVALDPAAFNKRAGDFWAWYTQQYYDQWLDFAQKFHLGMDKLSSREEWLNTGATMVTVQNPYFRLIARMDEELAALKDPSSDQAIKRLTGNFKHLVLSYQAAQKEASLKKKVAEKVQKLEATIEHLEKNLEAEAQFAEYIKQLGAFLPATASMNAAYRFSGRNFGSAAGAEQPSPVESAQTSVRILRQLLEKERDKEEPFWLLLEGPLDFLVTMATYETACGVNALWQSHVLAETVHTPQAELWETMFGGKGVVNSFVAGPAKPFLQRSQDGWTAGSWLGVPFPFSDEFLVFLNQGAVRRPQLQAKYTVSISTLPTNVNPEAKSEPTQTSLLLQCGDQSQTLDNLNFPNALDFAWEPATCGEVTLKIIFRETILSKTWPGALGFRDFLREFRTGRKVYTPKDFPPQQAMLEGLGVQNIQVNYTLKNAEPVKALKDFSPLRVPVQAAECWSGLGAGEFSDDSSLPPGGRP